MTGGGDAVLATRNAGKVAELLPLFSAAGWNVVTLDQLGVPEAAAEDDLEIHATFEENAIAKATWFAARLGQVVFADDSGLAVDALDGRPGVHSKRWSGRPDLHGAALDAHNNAALQQALSSAAAAGRHSRAAHYVCAAACVGPGGPRVARGETHGVLQLAPSGTNGFGYDPYFFSTELGMTFGEATRELKATVSHRARAFHALLVNGSS